MLSWLVLQPGKVFESRLDKHWESTTEVQRTIGLNLFRWCNAKEDTDLDTEDNVLRLVPSIDSIGR